MRARRTPSTPVVAIPKRERAWVPPTPLSATNSLTLFRNTGSQQDEALSGSPELFNLTPTSSKIQNKWPSPHLSLNSSHALEEDKIYTINRS